MGSSDFQKICLGFQYNNLMGLRGVLSKLEGIHADSWRGMR